MGRVECEVEYVTLQGDVKQIPSVVVRCSKCQHETESFGRTDRSVKRCLALMRKECPLGETNYYVASDENENDDDDNDAPVNKRLFNNFGDTRNGCKHSD